MKDQEELGDEEISYNDSRQRKNIKPKNGCKNDDIQ